jgi:hypothetical protein
MPTFISVANAATQLPICRGPWQSIWRGGAGGKSKTIEFDWAGQVHLRDT